MERGRPKAGITARISRDRHALFVHPIDGENGDADFTFASDLDRCSRDRLEARPTLRAVIF